MATLFEAFQLGVRNRQHIRRRHFEHAGFVSLTCTRDDMPDSACSSICTSLSRADWCRYPDRLELHGCEVVTQQRFTDGIHQWVIRDLHRQSVTGAAGISTLSFNPCRKRRQRVSSLAPDSKRGAS